MRTELRVTALSLAFVLDACGTRQQQTAALSDDLKKDLAAASVSTGDLAIAPQSYRRMRFVSDIEQSPTAVPAKRPKVSHHPVRPTVSHRHGSVATTDVAPDPVVAMASKSPEPVSTPAAPTEAPIAVAQTRPHAPSPEPASNPEPSEGNVGGGDRGHGGGWGGLLGGIIGAVVIRGGHGGVDHCDPRTDGRARPTVIDRPDFGLPLPTGTFPGSRRR